MKWFNELVIFIESTWNKAPFWIKIVLIIIIIPMAVRGLVFLIFDILSFLYILGFLAGMFLL